MISLSYTGASKYDTVAELGMRGHFICIGHKWIFLVKTAQHSIFPLYRWRVVYTATLVSDINFSPSISSLS